jgi:Mg2+ and Co2+ transporter CorA
MRQFTDFERDGDIVTAIPQSNNKEPVRFDATVVEREEDEIGNWEELVSELMDYDLGEALAIDEDGEAVINREQAVEALVKADEETVNPTSEWQATAVLDFLDQENVLEADKNGNVTVLKSFGDIADSDYPAMYNNWAAMFDTCIERIEVAEERVEEARERFQNRERETSSSSNVNPEQRQREIKREIAQVVGDRSQSELDDGERERVENLREQYYFYESMIGVKEVDIPDVADRVQKLGQVMERFSTMRDIMAERRDDFRRLALSESIYPENLIELAEQYSEFLSSMSNTFSPAEKMEEESLDDFLDDVATTEESIEQVEQTSGAVEQEIIPEK